MKLDGVSDGVSDSDEKARGMIEAKSPLYIIFQSARIFVSSRCLLPTLGFRSSRKVRSSPCCVPPTPAYEVGLALEAAERATARRGAAKRAAATQRK